MESPTFFKFGTYLKSCREREGIRIDQAAAQLGLGDSSYLLYEHGDVLPPIDQIDAIANLLDEPRDHVYAMYRDAQGADKTRWKEAAQRFVSAHKKSGLTRVKLAENAGVNESTIYDYEHGKRNPANSPDTVKRIADALGVTAEYLIGDCINSNTRIGEPKKNRINLAGREFGKLTVVDFAFVKRGDVYWNCKCACGNTTCVTSERLIRGKTTSCGCVKKSGQVGKETIKAMDAYRVDGTYIHGIEKKEPNKSNSTTGIRGVCYQKSHNTYKAYMRFKGKLYKREFRKIEDAIAYRKYLEDTLANPAVEDFYKELKSRNLTQDSQSSPGIAKTRSPIARARLELGMTQTQLAKAAGVRPQQIGYWERGERKPNLDVMRRLAFALNCSIEDLGG